MNATDTDLSQLEIDAIQALEKADNLTSLDEIRVKYLGKKGLITEQLKTLGNATPEERKVKGQQINLLKNSFTQKLSSKLSDLQQAEINAKLQNEKVDITLPVREVAKGSIHPITQVTEELISILQQYGFSFVDGPNVEDDFHNFTALNVPQHHPAREMQDTFFLKTEEGEEEKVLRTQTSSVQIRTMQAGKPPFRIISSGRVYRSDYDQTHTPMFHQLECLCVDKNINMGHLKYTLFEVLKKFFEVDELPLRFRPSYFPFTEPSAEVDVACKKTKQEIVIGQGDDWLEILGCGMVNHKVLENVGLDPNEWQGFAFGMGIERLAMLKYGIADLRNFFDSDVRWLNYYGFDEFNIPARKNRKS